MRLRGDYLRTPGILKEASDAIYVNLCGLGKLDEEPLLKMQEWLAWMR